MPARTLLTSLLIAAGTGNLLAAPRSFQAEGVDTGAGIGPRWVAQGGVGVAVADDLYAIYTNPAGLVGVEGLALSISRQLNAKLHAYNFIGAAWRLPLPQDWGFKATVAGSFYPRIHARASGAYSESDFESLFLRFLLPGVAGTFDGDIDSKTKTHRFAIGVAPSAASAWSLGAYVDHIDCRSNFCGVHATSNGFTTQSTGAKAYGYGLGLRYDLSPNLTAGLQLSDIRTRLTVNTITTDDAGTRSKTTNAAFPRKVAAGLAWRYSGNTRLAADYEVTKGRYGDTEIDLQMLRLGVERKDQAWSYRAGVLVPVKIHSSDSGTLHTPFPLSPTLGLGWQDGPFKLDFAVYTHAVMSMHKDKASPAADLSLSLVF